MPPSRVRIRGPLLDASDHAAGARVLARALECARAEVSLEQTPWGTPDVVSAAERAWLATRAVGGAADVLVQRTAARLLTPLGPPGMTRVAWTALAGVAADPETAARAAQMDGVWVPDEAQRAALIAAGVPASRVAVVPEPVDLGVVGPLAEPLRPDGAHGTVYLAVAGPDPADGADLLALAWAEAFASDDDVTLVLVPGAGERPADAGPLVAMLGEVLGARAAAVADVVVLDDAPSERRMAALLAGADVVVLPQRAGGLGRRHAEALAAGRPAVGPAARGVTDATGWPVPAPSAVPGAAAPALAGTSWWQPHVGAMAEALRDAHADAAGRRDRGAAARAVAEARHDHLSVAAVVLDHLAALRPTEPAPVVRVGARRVRVAVEGPLLGASSLAGVNRALVRGLAADPGLEVVAVETEAACADPLPPRGDAVREAVVAVPSGPPDVVVRNAHPPDPTPPPAGRLVLMLYWEYGALPEDWRPGARAADEVWVPSAQVRDGVLASGVPAGRVALVPLGVDAGRFHPGAPPADLGDAAPGTRFLFIGGLAWRKGADLLLQAHARAFTAADDVTLVLKDLGPGGPYTAGPIDDLADRMAADPSAPRVLRRSGPLASAALPGLYTACHCLVHPYRAEGFGLTMLEAMACGLPVLAPVHGPVGPLLSVPGAALPLASETVRAPSARIGAHTLPEPPLVGQVRVDDLAAAMRAVHADRAAAAAVGARAVAVARGATWAATGEAAAARVRALAAPAAVAA
jgi:glycosyltransferase involved in cell wall biosynthesis